AALAHLVAGLDPDRPDGSGGGRRHVHRRLVGLERHQRILGCDAVAGPDQHFDHRHVLEIADVRDSYLHGSSSVSPASVRHQTVQGSGRSVSRAYFAIASATMAGLTAPSSASAFSAATATW